MRTKITLLLITTIVLTFISFSSSLNNGFTNWDDEEYVTENPLIHDLSLENIKTIFAVSFKEAFRQPLPLISYSIEYRFFKLDPFIYHLDNLIIHILNTTLVFLLIFLLSRNPAISFIVAILFGVHPLHVESVAWVSERKDVLSTFFYLISLISYIQYCDKEKWSYYYLSIFVFILSLLSKAMGVTLPFILLLYDHLVERGINRKTLIEKIPFFVISGAFVLITLYTFSSANALESRHLYTPFHNLLLACRNIVFYLIKIFIPTNLSAYYPYPAPSSIGIFMPGYLFSFIFVIILGVAIVYIQYNRDVLFGSLFTLITLLPVVKLVPFGGGGAVAADRYMYIPSIGIFYILAILSERIYRRCNALNEWAGRVAILSFISMVIALSYLTYQRNQVWHDSETLWIDTIKKSPESSVAHNNLGLAYYGKGRINDALKEYLKAIELNPRYSEAYYNTGLAYYDMGLYNKAVESYKKALKFTWREEDLRDIYNNLGNAYAKMGLLMEAKRSYEAALKIAPDDPVARNNLKILNRVLNR